MRTIRQAADDLDQTVDAVREFLRESGRGDRAEFDSLSDQEFRRVRERFQTQVVRNSDTSASDVKSAEHPGPTVPRAEPAASESANPQTEAESYRSDTDAPAAAELGANLSGDTPEHEPPPDVFAERIRRFKELNGLDRPAAWTALDRILGRKMPNAAVVAVLGVPNAGKTYLNLRLAYLGKSEIERTDADGSRAVPGTSRAHFSVAEFDLPYGFSDKKRWRALVVDLPGELFKDVGKLEPGDRDRVSTALEQMDALVLYIPAPTMADQYFSAPDLHASKQTGDEDLYLHLLNKVRGGRARCDDKAVYIALSRADALQDWEEQKRTDAWAFLERHAPRLAEELSDHFSYFGCGFIAAYVDAECNGTLVFPREKDAANQAVTDEDVENRLHHWASFREYVLECWRHYKTFGNTVTGVLARLPGSESLGQGRTLEEHNKDAKEFFDFYSYDTNMDEAKRLLAGIAYVSRASFYNNKSESWGVRNFQQTLRRLCAACKLNDDRRLIPDYAMSRQARRWFNPIAEADRALSRLAVPRPWMPAGSFGRALLPLALCLITLSAAFLGFLLPYAEEEAATHNETVDRQIGALRDLPAGFAAEAKDIWAFDHAEARSVVARAYRARHSFAIQDDLLVRAPDFRLALAVPQTGQELHALKWSDSDNGKVVQNFYDLLGRCSADDRSCYETVKAVPVRLRYFGKPDNTQRAFFYSRAVHTYALTKEAPPEAVAQVERDLALFEEARRRIWPTSRQNKEYVLPRLAAGLLAAHLSLRADSEIPQALQKYWRAMGRVLGEATDHGNFTADELRAIGVDQGRLTMHSVVAALATFQDVQELRKELRARLERIGVEFDGAQPRLSASRAVIQQYPVAACATAMILYPPPERQRAADSTEWCTRLIDEPTSSKDDGERTQLSAVLRERADLVSGEAWSGVSGQRISFSRFLPALRAAAEKQLPTATPGEAKALRTLLQLRQTDTLGELIGMRGLLRLMTCLAIIVISGIALWRYMRLSRGALLVSKPLTQDSY